MKRRTRFGFLAVLGLIGSISAANSQMLVESVAAIVGNEVIYLSDVENNVLEMRRRDNKTPVDDIRCAIFQELLVSNCSLIRPD